ncbi:ATPase, T2SS/T4P/T4SS family [Aliivibrio sp. S3MY1]|uniref:ATPase, T2SS/T4P/T4SS family n=1 Tax=unclassified Aliivibrio TaxID=2645654 RepID=UPI00237891DE|nr:MULTISPECIES: ATPase, T2SS/T4P/T4SS family [unclassified Aliivibrio]MDD9175989.1 ATPase, T2SS/T4P/T4SS family [Aliivibrio sp. S3TY1]MDD9193096.1 ATPase, T2SS/T4P/T4SS family [Aliivibrio sp. S2TY2]MDD9195800.1 ATPase, T2SS/T4P/T4SS family [Aliivibrio sp. S3MY1]
MNNTPITSLDYFGTISSVVNAEELGFDHEISMQAAIVVGNDQNKMTVYALIDKDIQVKPEKDKQWLDQFLAAGRKKVLQPNKERFSDCSFKRTFVSKDIIKNACEQHGVNSKTSVDTQNTRINEIEKMLLDADTLGASDIHISGDKGHSFIKFRVNGELQLYGTERNQDEIFSLISVLYSNMAATEGSIEGEQFNELEQADAVLYRGIQNKRLGLRITTHPTTREKKQFYMVCRCLGDQKEYAKKIEFEELGFIFDQAKKIKEALRARGMVLTIGETNSGKSVSQQNYLMQIRDDENNTTSIYAMENPIERQMKGIIQFNIIESGSRVDGGSERQAEALQKFFMRADPNTLALAEIRDLMSVDTAQKLAQTGHKVFATLHCESPFDVYERMVGLGANASTLSNGQILGAVISQKLLKKICPTCAHTIETLPHINEDQMIALEQLCTMELGHKIKDIRFRNNSSTNCEHPKCNNGLIGRKLVAEIVNIDVNLLSYLASGDKQEALKYWLTKENLTKSDVALHALFKGEVEIENIITEIGDLTSTYNIRKELNINHPSQIYV